MSKICILDYGSGNVGSAYNLFRHVADQVVISNLAADVDDASHIVLPGVGAFGAAMRKIAQTLPLRQLEMSVVTGGKPFLGICVGMQVLADRGSEFGDHAGLGWIKGIVKQLDTKGLPLPHIGWNNVDAAVATGLFDGLGQSPDFYYVHSYAFQAENPADVVATTEFGQRFVAAVQRDNILGVQFHPEKSQTAGLRLARNFVALT